jgi:NAD(P)-dependent dehydrogenase (short-subunit alcohol dehydrogenase family)
VGLALIEAWPVEEDSESPPLPLTGLDEPPGMPGVDTQPPCPGVGNDGGVSGSVGSDGGVSDGGVREGGVSDGGVPEGAVGSDGDVSDDEFTVTDPPPDALVPPADPAPWTLPPDDEAVALTDAWAPPGREADDGSAAVLAAVRAPWFDAGAAPLSKMPAAAAVPPAARASAAAAPSRPRSRLRRCGASSDAASRSCVVIVAPSGVSVAATGRSTRALPGGAAAVDPVVERAESTDLSCVNPVPRPSPPLQRWGRRAVHRPQHGPDPPLGHNLRPEDVDQDDMARVLITGSSDGLGLLAGRRLAADGHAVTLHARNEERAKVARGALPAAESVLVADVSCIQETRRLAEEANQTGRFDAVIHNVAVGHREASRRETIDGLEHVFAVNVLAPYLLTCLMVRPSRLVYLTSGLHRRGAPCFEDLQWIRRPWNAFDAYADSKFLDVALAFAVARSWADVPCNAVEPGWVPTKMGGVDAPDDLELGAATQVWLAVSDDSEAGVTGQCFFHRRLQEPHPEARSRDVHEQLLAACVALTGTELPAPPYSH